MGEKVSPDNIAAIHGILARDFTDRYIKRTHASAIAYSQPYDTANEYCDYDKTWWEASPVKHGEALASFMMAAIFRLRPKTRRLVFQQPMEAKAKELASALHDFNLMIITDHSPDLLAVLPLHGLVQALANRQGGGQDYDRRRELETLYKQSHVVATRGFVPLKFGRRELPQRSNTLSIVRAGRMIMNPHFTFPRTRQMKSSGIPEEFIKDYNAKARADMVAVAHSPTEHPAGLKQIWAEAPSGGPNIKVEMPGHCRAVILQKVGEASTKLVKDMGVGLLPIKHSWPPGQKPLAVVQDVIPPNEITDFTLAELMEQQAHFRRAFGEPHVIYAEDPIAAPYLEFHYQKQAAKA